MTPLCSHTDIGEAVPTVATLVRIPLVPIASVLSSQIDWSEKQNMDELPIRLALEALNWMNDSPGTGSSKAVDGSSTSTPAVVNRNGNPGLEPETFVYD